MPARHIELLYPFTPSIVGVSEEDIISLHANSIVDSLASVSNQHQLQCQIGYLTGKRGCYTQGNGVLSYRFYPLSFRRREGSDRFGNQWSLAYIRHLLLQPPRVLGLFINSGWFAVSIGFLCRLRGIPYFIIAGGRGLPRGRSHRAFYRYAHRVLVHTAGHRDWLVRERGCDPDNIEVFPVGVNVAQFSGKSFSSYKRQDAWPRLLYVGRLVPGKGALEAVEAFAQIKDAFPEARLTIVGPYCEGLYMNKIRSSAEESGVSQSVFLAGPVPHDDLPQWYQEADLFLFPSQWESFGMVVVESMATGTPVVAVKGSGGPDEIISHGEDGSLVQLPKIGVEATRLLRDRQRLKQMGKRARFKVKTRFNAKRTHQQIKNLLNEIVQNPAGER